MSPCQLLPVERDAGGKLGGRVLAQSPHQVSWVAMGGEGGAWSGATCPRPPSELEITILHGPNFTHESAFPPAATFSPSVPQPQPRGSPAGSPASFLSGCLATLPQPFKPASLELLSLSRGAGVSAALPPKAPSHSELLERRGLKYIWLNFLPSPPPFPSLFFWDFFSSQRLHQLAPSLLDH